MFLPRFKSAGEMRACVERDCWCHMLRGFTVLRVRFDDRRLVAFVDLVRGQLLLTGGRN